MYTTTFINTRFVNKLEQKAQPLNLIKQFTFKRKNILFIAKPEKALKTLIRLFQLVNYTINNQPEMDIQLQNPNNKTKELAHKMLNTCYKHKQLNNNKNSSLSILLDKKTNQNILQTKLLPSNITTTTYNHFQIDYVVLVALLDNAKHTYQFTKCLYQVKTLRKHDKRNGN